MRIPARSGRPRINRLLQPTKRYEAIFSQARGEFRRRDSGIKLHTEIAVSRHQFDARPVNRSRSRTIELTSYAEVVWRHRIRRDAPAFSNLFVQTGLSNDRRLLRGAGGPGTPWMLHLMACTVRPMARRLMRQTA